MTATAELPDVAETFSGALAADAGRTQAGPPVAAPPRKSDNPDAPHGYEPDGTTPLAPYGHKADGRPRIKPGGPGRARSSDRDDKPRVVSVRPESAAAAPSSPGGSPGSGGPDYTEQLAELGSAIWLGASVLRGGRLWVVKLPDTRPYAAVWSTQLPGLVAAWNSAAKQNATVRSYVESLSGEGSKAWMIGVAVTSASLVSACVEMARSAPEIKAAAAARNDAELEQFIKAQVAELGLEEPAEPAGLGAAGRAAAA